MLKNMIFFKKMSFTNINIVPTQSTVPHKTATLFLSQLYLQVDPKRKNG